MRSIRDIFRSHAVLDSQGRHTNGTDKQSNHNYGDAYESLFPTAEAREAVRLVLEVGVADGACLRAWAEVFPNARVVGMDIHDSALARGHPQIEFHLGNQCSYRSCEHVAGNRQFDLIVEDAMHNLPHTLQTLFYLWPYVRPSGYYVVEEWDNIGATRRNIADLFPFARIIDTVGPFGGTEPLVALQKPKWTVDFPPVVNYKPQENA